MLSIDITSKNWHTVSDKFSYSETTKFSHIRKGNTGIEYSYKNLEPNIPLIPNNCMTNSAKLKLNIALLILNQISRIQVGVVDEDEVEKNMEVAVLIFPLLCRDLDHPLLTQLLVKYYYHHLYQMTFTYLMILYLHYLQWIMKMRKLR